MKLLKDLSQPV